MCVYVEKRELVHSVCDDDGGERGKNDDLPIYLNTDTICHCSTSVCVLFLIALTSIEHSSSGRYLFSSILLCVLVELERFTPAPSRVCNNARDLLL